MRSLRSSSADRIGLAVAMMMGAAACTQGQVEPRAGDQEPVIGLPCDGCEAVFEGLPSELSWTARIAPEDEPGEPMRIEGTVYDADGRPAQGVIVYAYHTDDGGVYPPNDQPRGSAAFRHGRLRGWARTDELGRYRFETIRPGSYPSRDNPAHVHMHVIEVGCCTYYIDSIHFDDDPLLPEDSEERDDARGGRGLVTPRRDSDGVWQVRRDIHLGRGVPGYPNARR